MKRDKPESDKARDLRRRAETKVRATREDTPELSPNGNPDLLHELRTHQIELEMQNEELRKAQVELEKSRSKYADLYDFAPVGYFSVSPKGLVLEANLAGCALLGLERASLLKRRFTSFVSPDFQDAFHLHCNRLLDTETRQACELPVVRMDGSSFQALLESVLVHDDERQIDTYRIAVSDITDRARMEQKIRVARRFLEIANQAVGMNSLLKGFIAETRKLTGCQAVGIRLLDETGKIPYQAYEGFSRAFYEKESPLSIHSDQCVCVNVVMGKQDSGLPWSTDAGSFYMNGTTRMLAAIPEEKKGPTRNVCNRFGYETVALVPIRVEDSILGLIHVADTRDDMMPLEKVELLEQAALELGSAVKRVWAEEELHEANQQLERRVEGRTAELKKTNRVLKREIREHQRTQEALSGSERELRILSARLLEAQEEERRRVSRDIHDGIGQSLSAIKFHIENIHQTQGPQIDDAGRESFGSVIPMIQEAIEEVRRISRNLRPPTLDELGLLPTINWFCREFQELHSSIRIEKRVDITEDEVPLRLKTVIYRIQQEAFNNIAQHSQADFLRISLTRADGRIDLTIEDNGRGFDLGTTLMSDKPEKGIGLSSMRERAELVGGSFVVESQRESGTTVRASWPTGAGAFSG